MKRLSILLADGNYDGDVTLKSSKSKIVAVRATRETFQMYTSELNHVGVYILMLGSNTVYVGQTGRECIDRVFKSHTDGLERNWHTALAFSFPNSSISENELKYIENALCEYAHKNYDCKTQTPAEANCTIEYRDRQNHYNLDTWQMLNCKDYIKDILFYIDQFPHSSIFPPQHIPSPTSNDTATSVIVESSEPVQTTNTPEETALFHYHNSSRGVDGYAEIAIHLGSASPNRDVVLKRGAVFGAISTAPSFATTANKIKKKRDELSRNGDLVRNVLQVDIPINNTNFALEVLTGVSLSAPENWKTADGTKLKDLLL